MPTERGERTLTEGDVEAIVNALWVRGKDEFFASLGKGLFSLILAALTAALLFTAILGAKISDKIG